MVKASKKSFLLMLTAILFSSTAMAQDFDLGVGDEEVVSTGNTSDTGNKTHKFGLGSLLSGIFGGSKQPEEPPETYNSLREHLKFNKWTFIPLTETETLICIMGERGIGVVSGEINLATAFYDYCKHHGGKLISGSGLEKVAFSDFLDSKGRYKIFTAENEMMKYFGHNTIYKCEGGDDPFIVTVSGKGNSEYYRSTGNTRYVVFAYVQATKPDAMIDNGFYKSINKYKKMDLKAFIKSEDRFLGDLDFGSWRGNKYFAKTSLRDPNPTWGYNPESWSSGMGIVWKSAEFCKAHGGEFRKIQNGKNLSLKEWLKDFLMVNKGYVKHLTGLYYCDSLEMPFMEQLSYENGKFKIIIMKGIDKSIIEATASAYQNTVNAKPRRQPTVSGYSSTEDKLALRASDGGEIFKKSGAYTYRATYNGRDGSCSLVSVIRRTDGFKTVDIFNYKICNGQIVKKEMTGVEKVPSDVKALIPQVAKMAQLHGRAEMDANGGFRVIANAVRDERKCNVEVKILRGILLIKDEIVNACNY